MSILKVGEVSKDVNLVGKRDAVHVPVILVFSSMTLKAGQNVKFTDKLMNEVTFCSKHERQAIVDPFVEHVLVPGDIFHVLLEPSLVSNLTHQFDIASNEVNETIDEVDEDVDDEEYNSCRGCY